MRTCMACGEPMGCGMTDEGNGMGGNFHAHEGECFDKAWADAFGPLRTCCEDGDGCGGYYMAYDAREGAWYGTGVYYTEWEDE